MPGILIANNQRKEGEPSDLFCRRRRNIVKKGRNTAEIPGSDGELDDIKLPESSDQGRTLIFKAALQSKRVQLIAEA